MLNRLDDCSRLFTGSKLYEHENLPAYFDFLPAAFLECGLPLELYVDFHSFFFTQVPDALTQLGKARRFHGVSFLYAPTPQAKGKIEREHQCWQNRLPAYFASENISDLAQANPYITNLRLHRNQHELHRELNLKPQQAWDTAKKQKRSVRPPSRAVRGGPSSGADAPSSKSAPTGGSPSAPNASASRRPQKTNSSSVITPPATTRSWPPNPIQKPNPKSSSPTSQNDLSGFENYRQLFRFISPPEIVFIRLRGRAQPLHSLD
jgi:hypothetical protein